MALSSSDPAPALTRGLAILQQASRTPEGVSFSALLETQEMPKATLARLLRVLRDGGYLVKDEVSGLYRLGPAMAAFATPRSESERLREMARPRLTRLRDESGNTAALVYLDGLTMVFLAKVMHEAAVPMRPEGAASLDVSEGPWGWIFYHALSGPELKHVEGLIHNRKAFQREWAQVERFITERGAAYDDAQRIENVRRLAAPVRDAERRIRAAVVLGGNPFTLPDDAIDPACRLLNEAAHDLECDMGWTSS